MKKVFCLFLSAMLLATLCVSPALAANSAQGQSVDTPYEYPVLPGTPAWNELDSLEEKIAVCHVNEELLASMTTAALLETVLNYPLLVNIYAFSSIEMGIESVSQYFPGLPLLLAREDAMECLSSYSEAAPLSENDTETVVRQTSASVLARYMSESNISPLISTPGGTPIESYYNLTWSDWGMTRAQAQANHDALAARYPKATEVSGINPAYNCHSYAWYSTSTSNKYWIDNPDPYMADGSYTKKSSPSANDKACWSGSPYPVHSAIVRSVSGRTITYISKWGFNGVFIHSANDCPYTGSITYWGK